MNRAAKRALNKQINSRNNNKSRTPIGFNPGVSYEDAKAVTAAVNKKGLAAEADAFIADLRMEAEEEARQYNIARSDYENVYGGDPLIAFDELISMENRTSANPKQVLTQKINRLRLDPSLSKGQDGKVLREMTKGSDWGEESQRPLGINGPFQTDSDIANHFDIKGGLTVQDLLAMDDPTIGATMKYVDNVGSPTEFLSDNTYRRLQDAYISMQSQGSQRTRDEVKSAKRIVAAKAAGLVPNKSDMQTLITGFNRKGAEYYGQQALKMSDPDLRAATTGERSYPVGKRYARSNKNNPHNTDRFVEQGIYLTKEDLAEAADYRYVDGKGNIIVSDMQTGTLGDTLMDTDINLGLLKEYSGDIGDLQQLLEKEAISRKAAGKSIDLDSLMESLANQNLTEPVADPPYYRNGIRGYKPGKVLSGQPYSQRFNPTATSPKFIDGEIRSPGMNVSQYQMDNIVYGLMDSGQSRMNRPEGMIPKQYVQVDAAKANELVGKLASEGDLKLDKWGVHYNSSAGKVESPVTLADLANANAASLLVKKQALLDQLQR